MMAVHLRAKALSHPASHPSRQPSLEPKPIDSLYLPCYPRAIRARILLLIVAFALLPSCRKAPPPMPEKIARAEAEIKGLAVKVNDATQILEGITATGEALVQKAKLDELQAELLAVREKNKDTIPMDASKSLADETIAKRRAEINEGERKISEKYNERLREAREDPK